MGKVFNGNVGHGFQEERSGAEIDPSWPNRDIHRRALSTYRGGDESPEGQRERINRRQVDFLQFSVPYDGTPFLYLPAGRRSYLLIQNIDLAFTLFVGFGVVPNQATSFGLKIAAGQAFEPYMIPQNDVWLTGTGTGVATVIYAVN
ncbi:MAG: hypothetical protein ACRERV_18705 [Methylococcales bacterium]